MYVLSLLSQSIIRDYGQRRLREIEAHRQLVKPLKQLGTNKRLLGIRNLAAGFNVSAAPIVLGSPGPGSGASTPRCNSGSGSAASPRLNNSKSKMYGRFSDDPESLITFSGSSEQGGFFRSICATFRRIFHRKVRRQKSLSSQGGIDDAELTSDSLRSEGKLAWMADDQDSPGTKMVRLCCNSGNEEETRRRGRRLIRR